jgi:hypothetical protein
MFDDPGIPKGLAEIPPGPWLAGILASIDRDSLTGHDRVVLMQAQRRQVAHYEAELYASMNAVVESTEELDLESAVDAAADEIRAALTLTRRSAENQLGFAQQLVVDYPHVWEALQSGSIDVPRAMVLVNATCHLEPEHRDAVVEEGLKRAPTQTTGQLRARLDRFAMAIDPDVARKRYQQGLDGRHVAVEANSDGTANLYGISLAAADTQAALRRVNRIAKSLKTGDEERSLDQLRADVFLDLLNGRGQDRGAGINRGAVEITVDLQTLAGLSESPGELNGYGPVIADVARQVVLDQADSTHRITVKDRGNPIWTGTTRRRATTHQTRQVGVRNRTCVFPGCRMPAADCDLDHTQDFAMGGPTIVDNLAPLCRHDHRAKHQRGWTLERHGPGAYQWTSPLGHTYAVGPDPP